MKALLLFLLLPAFSYCQKITVNEIDKFTNQKRIETGWAFIKPTLSAPLSIKLRSAGKSVFITLAGANYGANVIGPDATAIFLLADSSQIVITSTGIQSYDIGEHGKYYRHQYSISLTDLASLSQHLITSIRKSDTDTYHDFDISEKPAKKFKEFIAKFLTEFDKQ